MTLTFMTATLSALGLPLKTDSAPESYSETAAYL